MQAKKTKRAIFGSINIDTVHHKSIHFSNFVCYVNFQWGYSMNKLVNAIKNNPGKVLTTLLVLSELLAFWCPETGGITKALISILQTVGAQALPPL